MVVKQYLKLDPGLEITHLYGQKTTSTEGGQELRDILQKRRLHATTLLWDVKLPPVELLNYQER